MSLIPKPIIDGDLTFTPFFRFLDDFNKYADTGDLQTFSPKFDIQEHKHSYTLHGELPGVEGKDVEVEFSDPTTIRIHGHTEKSYESPKEGEEAAEGEPKVWRSERKVGDFSRSFSFPVQVDQDHVQASMKNGILSLTVPKLKKHAMNKKITVQ